MQGLTFCALSLKMPIHAPQIKQQCKRGPKRHFLAQKHVVIIIIIIIIIIITRVIFVVLSSWHSHCESSPGSFDECRLSAEVAANPRPSQPTWTASRQERMAATVHIRHRHFIITQPESWYSFTVPRKVEGWVNLGTAVRVCSPCPRLYIAVAVVINTTVTAGGEIRTWVTGSSHTAVHT